MALQATAPLSDSSNRKAAARSGSGGQKLQALHTSAAVLPQLAAVLTPGAGSASAADDSTLGTFVSIEVGEALEKLRASAPEFELYVQYQHVTRTCFA